MKIKTVVVGELDTNCYLLEKDNEVLVIDPGADFATIKSNVGDNKVVGCLLTHHHFDHIGALDEILEYYKLKKNDYHGKTFKFKVIKTPGHTDDSISFYFEEEDVMFVGDFIFNSSIGRTDLGGNDYDMIKSLDMISTYEDNIIIYPGHGPKTILGEEKRRFSNYY